MVLLNYVGAMYQIQDIAMDGKIWTVWWSYSCTKVPYVSVQGDIQYACMAKAQSYSTFLNIYVYRIYTSINGCDGDVRSRVRGKVRLECLIGRKYTFLLSRRRHRNYHAGS